MTIQLDNFEQQIDPAILKRGYEYFKKGYITDVDDLGDGDYEATVEGSETYTVRLHVEGNEVTDYECDCPYDWGAVCKHVVAVLFYLRKDLLESGGLSQKEKRSKPKKESEATQFEKLLKLVSHDELRTFLREVCAGDKSLRRLFIAKYVSHLYPESKGLYDTQVQKLMDTYTDRYGFIGYYEASKLGKSIYEMIGQAKQSAETGKKQKALYMVEAIIEGMIEAIENADDSNGEIGGCLNSAFGVLSQLAESGLDEPLHDEMFGWLLHHHEAKTMKGWSWHTDLMWIAISMVKTKEEKERIRTDLEQIKPNGKDWDWDYRLAQKLRLRLIEKTEDESAAIRFMETNLDNSDFRKELIEKAMREEDFAKAERLANEGVEKDGEKSLRLVEDWRYYLLQVYQATHDTERVISLARHFFVDGSDRHQPRKYYYDLLQSLIPQLQWRKYVDNLIAAISGKSCWEVDYDRVAEIYMWEEQFDKLFELLRKYPDFYRVEEAEKYLAANYAEELAGMYRDLIVDYLPNHVGRNHYEMVCKYLRRIIKLGCKPLAMELAGQLKTQYRNRRALLQELAQI